MADRKSSAVGYRLRMQPTDLSTYPDRIKLMWFQWIVDLGLEAKDRDLAKGKDKDGNVHPLKPRTIKYRRSQVGPVHKHAPRLIPALDLSRVRSLLTGRAHLSSAEFWWKFDSVTHESFAVILHYQAEEYGHDVFGLSPAGTAWVTSEATKKWNAWKAAGGANRATAEAPGAKVIRRPEFLNPIRKLNLWGEKDLKKFDIAGDQEQVKRAILEGTSPGFRRLNTSFEQWTPGTGLGPGPGVPRQPKPVKPPLPASPVSPASVKLAPAARVAELSDYTVKTLGVPSQVLDVESFTGRFAGAAIDKARAAYDPKTKTIFWNLNSPAWADPAKHFETQRKEKMLVDPRPIGVAHHEAGHALLHAELIRRFGETEAIKRYWDLARDEFKTDILLRALIKKEVSRVAALDKNEFVAEIYSGLVIGRTYSPEVLAFYDALGGVRP